MTKKEELEKLYDEHMEKRAPTGLLASVDGLDVDILIYSDEMPGFVHTYLHGGRVNKRLLNTRDDLTPRIEEAQAKLSEYRARKERTDAMIRFLIECIAEDEE